MKTKIYDIELIHNEKYLEEVSIINYIYSDIKSMVNKLWGFNENNKKIIFITKSSIKFIFYTLPTYKKILLFLVFPMWFINIKDSLSKWGNITYKKDNTDFIMIKPIEVYDNIESVTSKMLYKKIKDKKMMYKISSIFGIVNIFSSSVNLAIWLSKGINIVTVENIIKKILVKFNTILLFKEKPYTKNSYSGIEKYKDNMVLTYNYAKGYWTVRYLEENYPGFLKEIFKEYKGEEIVEQIILKLGLDSDNYWEQLDELLYENYKHLLEK